MISPPDSEVGTVLVLKADCLCASILQQTALKAFPSAIVNVATSLRAATAELRTRPVDLLLTGIVLLDGDALELLSATGAERNFRYALVVTGRREARVLTILRELAIGGVFDPMNEDLDQLETAIRRVGEGNAYWSGSVLARFGNTNSSTPPLSRLLSPTEQLVLAVIGDGSDDEVAAMRLNLKSSTIHSIRRELHRKLGCSTKASSCAWRCSTATFGSPRKACPARVFPACSQPAGDDRVWAAARFVIARSPA